MILFKKSNQIREYIRKAKLRGGKTGFVPTMGALHTGHLSLLEASKKNNELTACSIFVNPTQFNDPKDFQKYPITIEKDIYLLEQCGTDILFLPDANEIYPHGTQQLEKYELGYLENILEGKFRPGHFQGVCQVMNRLLEIICPHNLYMGQKDYQQCMIVNTMLRQFYPGITLHICTTIREHDGLAMSSRNARLSADEREKAASIYVVLKFLKDNIQPGSLEHIKSTAGMMLEKNHCRPDYVALADADTLEEVNHWDGEQKLVALIAAFTGEVRLIDNMIITG